MDLTEDIKKRWQEYTEELYKKDLNDPDNHNGVITHLEPDILECEVKWAGREAALAWASLAQRSPASSLLAREGAGCGSHLTSHSRMSGSR